jgi:hypothetical protein
MVDRSGIKRGAFIIADGGRAETDQRRVAVTKGQFMTGDGGRAEPAQAYAFATHADAIKVLAARLRAVKDQLDSLNNKARE